jgi:hypothetical protein
LHVRAPCAYSSWGWPCHPVAGRQDRRRNARPFCYLAPSHRLCLMRRFVGGKDVCARGAPTGDFKKEERRTGYEYSAFVRATRARFACTVIGLLSRSLVVPPTTPASQPRRVPFLLHSLRQYLRFRSGRERGSADGAGVLWPAPQMR